MSIDIVESQSSQARSDADMTKAGDGKQKQKKSVRFTPVCTMRVYRNGPQESERKDVWYSAHEYEMFRRQIMLIAKSLYRDGGDAVERNTILSETLTLGIEHIVNKRRMQVRQKRRLNAMTAVLDQQDLDSESDASISSSQSSIADGFDVYHHYSELCQAEAHQHAMALVRSLNSCCYTKSQITPLKRSMS
jgi:hypothetical protein